MPTPMPKNVEIEFYHVIGGLVVRYGYIDSLIATVCKNLFEDLGGHSSQKRAPRPMGVRLEYIGKCARNKPELSAQRDRMEAFCDLVSQIDWFRNFVIHGCMTEYFPDPVAPSFQFTKLDTRLDGTGYDQVSMTICRSDLVQLAQASGEVVDSIRIVGTELRDMVAAEKGQK